MLFWNSDHFSPLPWVLIPQNLQNSFFWPSLTKQVSLVLWKFQLGWEKQLLLIHPIMVLDRESPAGASSHSKVIRASKQLHCSGSWFSLSVKWDQDLPQQVLVRIEINQKEIIRKDPGNFSFPFYHLNDLLLWEAAFLILEGGRWGVGWEGGGCWRSRCFSSTEQVLRYWSNMIGPEHMFHL